MEPASCRFATEYEKNNKIMKRIIAAIGCLAAMAIIPVQAQERFVDETPQNRKVVLEEFTGMNCPFCPMGHSRTNKIRDAHPGEVFIINIHQGKLASPTGNQPDYRTNYGDALAQEVVVESYPTLSVNRHVFPNQEAIGLINENGSVWENCAEEILGMDAYVNVAARASVDWQNRQIDITVQLYYTGDSPQSTNYLNIALIQDYIYGYQTGGSEYNPAQVDNGQYVHMHALRDLVTGQWGEEITTTSAGSFVEKTYTYTVPESVRDIPVDLRNISLVVFVAESHAEIINGCEAELSFTNGGPDYILHMDQFQQVPNHTCDNQVLFSAKLDLRAAAQDVSNLTFQFETPSGIQEYTHAFEPALKAGSSTVFTSQPLAFPLNQEAQATLRLTTVNGSENFPEIDSMSADFSKFWMNIPSQDMILHVEQDQYGEEITWNIVTDALDTLASGGPYANLSSMGTRGRIDTVTLVEGCQRFTIYDATGDGIHNTQGDGFIEFSDIEGNSLLVRDGNYDDSTVVMLSYNLPFANERDAEQIQARLYPNPASTSATLVFETEKACQVSIRVLNQAGQCVFDMGKQTLASGSCAIEIPVERLGNGLYFVQVQGKGFQGIKKLVVNR